MSKKRTAGIVVLILIGIIGLLYGLGQVGLHLERSGANSTSLTATLNGTTRNNNNNNSPDTDPQAFVHEVRAYAQQQGWSDAPQQGGGINMTRVAEGIVWSKHLKNSAMVVITENWNQCWSGSIMGSDGVKSTHQACNTAYLSIPCSRLYSLAIQRTGESDGTMLLVQIWKGGQLLKQGDTKADYGVVSFAGNCS
jgi:hypothetical protein